MKKAIGLFSVYLRLYEIFPFHQKYMTNHFWNKLGGFFVQTGRILIPTLIINLTVKKNNR